MSGSFSWWLQACCAIFGFGLLRCVCGWDLRRGFCVACDWSYQFFGTSTCVYSSPWWGFGEQSMWGRIDRLEFCALRSEKIFGLAGWVFRFRRCRYRLWLLVSGLFWICCSFWQMYSNRFVRFGEEDMSSYVGSGHLTGKCQCWRVCSFIFCRCKYDLIIV